MGTRCAILLGCVLAAGCRPDLGAPASLVDSARVLAVRGDPPESALRAMVSYRLLLASPEGTVADPAAEWAFCTAQRPLTENNIVSPDCTGEGKTVDLGGPSASIQAETPMDACALFGPDTKSAEPGQPPLRPRDPDVTGGYYQPLRVRVPEVNDFAFGLERVTCNLANAPIEVAQEFVRRYRPNQNPMLREVTPVPGSRVAPGERVTLEASWTPESAETFPVFDLTVRALVDHREAIRVSWFATAGKFDHDRTGTGENDPGSSSSNQWLAPAEPGVVHFWVVLRDSRGGIDWMSFDLGVGPVAGP